MNVSTKLNYIFYICLVIVLLHVWTEKLLFSPQFSEQMPSESSDVRRSAGAVPESYRDLRAGQMAFIRLSFAASPAVVLKRTQRGLFMFLGWNPRDGQYAPEIQRQGPLLQGSPLPLLCRHAECEGERRSDSCLLQSRCNLSCCFNNRSAVSQLAVQKYEEMFPAFSDSRECKLLKVGFWASGLLCHLHSELERAFWRLFDLCRRKDLPTAFSCRSYQRG